MSAEATGAREALELTEDEARVTLDALEEFARAAGVRVGEIACQPDRWQRTERVQANAALAITAGDVIAKLTRLLTGGLAEPAYAFVGASQNAPQSAGNGPGDQPPASRESGLSTPPSPQNGAGAVEAGEDGRVWRVEANAAGLLVATSDEDDGLEQEWEDAIDTLGKVIADRAEILARAQRAEREREEWQGHYAAAEQQNSMLRETVERHGETLRELREERDELLRRLTASANGMDQLQAKLDAATQEIEETRVVLGSPSESLTTPEGARVITFGLEAAHAIIEELEKQLAEAREQLDAANARIGEGDVLWRDADGDHWRDPDDRMREIYGPFTRGRFVPDQEGGR